ncbi:MAG: SLC13 family permease [Pontixanthobacter sp.]
MSARPIGFVIGTAAFGATLLTTPPVGMPREAWLVAGLVIWMAAWWMTEAVPLTVTALLPFVVLPFAGVMDARDTASAYYAPILFLILGGAFIALAIERTGLHRRLSLAILTSVGSGTGIPKAPARLAFALIISASLLSLAIFNVSTSLIVLVVASAILGGLVLSGAEKLLLAFMVSAAVLSMLISNTSTALIMMPMAIAVLTGGGLLNDDQEGLAGALPMGIAFAASIGGLGTIVGSPTNGIAVALLDSMIGLQIGFAEWTLYGLPIVIVGVPVAAFIIARVQKVADHHFDVDAARDAIATQTAWTGPEKRLVPLIAITFALWMTAPFLKAYVPDGALTDGTIAIVAGILLFVIPDGTGRPLLIWAEADRAPWGVILMFGGGLALAAGWRWRRA